jgi:hypothetical protein
MGGKNMKSTMAVPSGAFIACVFAAALAGGAAAQSDEPSPDPLAPTWVTGSILLAESCEDAVRTVENGVTEERGYRCGPQTWMLSDPRLSGSATSTWNADVYSLDGSTVSVRAGAYDVENEAGAWRCTFSGHLAHGSGLIPESVNEETVSCGGSGGYEGLTAILVIDLTTTPFPIEGIIVPGEEPPVP